MRGNTKQRAIIGLVAVVGLAAAALLAVLGLPYGRSNPEAFAHTYTHPVSGLVMYLNIDAVKDGNTGTPADWCNPIQNSGAAVVGLSHQVGICLGGYTAPAAVDAPEDVNAGQCLNGLDEDLDTVIDDGCSQAGKLESFELSITNDDALDLAPDPQGIEDQAGEGGLDIANCSDDADNDGDGKIDMYPGNEDEECIGATTATSLEDNPDANNTAGPGGLGTTNGDDCSGLGLTPPRGSPLPIHIVCNAKIGTNYELATDPGLLATVTLDALAPGTDNLSFVSATDIGFTAPAISGSCFIGGGNIGCFGAAIDKVYDLGITKVAVPDPAIAGSDVTFNFNLTNSGVAPAAVMVFDDLDNDLVYNDAASDPSCSLMIPPGAPSPGVPEYPPDFTNVVQCGPFVVPPAGLTVAPGVVANVPLLEAGKKVANGVGIAPGDPNTANDVDYIQVDVAASNMTLTDVGLPAVNSVGDNITWTLTATSTGDSPASGVVITKDVDDNQCITGASLDVAGACVISVVGTTTPCVAPEGNKAVCTVTSPMAKNDVAVATILAEVVASDQGPVANHCTNLATVDWEEPSYSPPAGDVVCLPPTVRMEKDVDTDATSIDNDVNLFIEKDGAGGFVPLVIYELVSNPQNDTDGVGAYEFQIKFNHKLFDIEIADTSWLSNSDGNPPSLIPPYVPRTVTCDMTIITENDIRWGCVSSGMTPGQLDAGVAAIITVYPEPDMYLRLTPGQENGVFGMLLDENCELADVMGDPLRLEDGSLAPGILPGGLVAVCSDMGITIRILEGDLDLDCVVGLLDEQAIAFRYGAVFGTLYYDPWYDLEPWNKDYDIDIKDLQKVWGRQGSVCGLNGEGTIPPQLPLPIPDP